MPSDREFPPFSFNRRRYPAEDLPEQTQERLRQLAEGAHDAGNASVAANPSDPAFWMLLDGHESIPVVHLDSCYICRDPEFAAMGMPLCSPCPQCVRERMNLCAACRGTRGLPGGPLCQACEVKGYTGTLGHIAADDETCDECGYQHGPWDYGDDGTLTGMEPQKAWFIWSLKHPRQPEP